MQQWVVPQRRKLTLGERELALSVFAQHLQLDEIEIVASRLILPHYAMSPNGSIYFNPQDWRVDFSRESVYLQSWLIHELVHVWQIQQGIAVVRKAIFDRRYDYVLTAGKEFLHYGVEQQAQMVQDYFLATHTGRECQKLKQCIPFCV